MKIAVGLSGGIDSTATLLRLHEEGHDVIGMTMKATFNNQEHGKCCSIEDVHDARKVCQSIGVRHYVIDVKNEFYEKIIRYFIEDYLKGNTPNPCLFCNELIKFKKLIEAASTLGYNYFATGHYAILDRVNGELILRKGVDPLKDQAYFLSRLPLELLEHCLFPLGRTTKEENKQFLADRNVSISQKRESHEICFVPGDDYTQFLMNEVGDQIHKGDIIDSESREKVGEHSGIPFYTIGQRKGLNIAMGKPVYVREIDAENNRIVIGEKPYEDKLKINQINWLTEYDFDHKKKLLVKVRYFHQGEIAVLKKINDEEVEIHFDKPVFSVTRGQGAVGYLDDRVIFSGIII